MTPPHTPAQLENICFSLVRGKKYVPLWGVVQQNANIFLLYTKQCHPSHFCYKFITDKIISGDFPTVCLCVNVSMCGRMRVNILRRKTQDKTKLIKGGKKYDTKFDGAAFPLTFCLLNLNEFHFFPFGREGECRKLHYQQQHESKFGKFNINKS